jgi:hypothetical protein
VGRDAINPRTRENAPRQTEYDLTVDYRPARVTPAFLKGLWLRPRRRSGPGRRQAAGYQFRLILNWERALL